jgi:iron complex transport system ATP-binding protein
MIDIRSLTLRYPQAEAEAVAEVSFAVSRGALTAIVGPNGSGKSTIVRALLGLLRPLSGSVTLDGTDVRQIPRRALARKMAVVPQREEPAFPLLVPDYVSLGRLPHQSPWRGRSLSDARIVDSAMERAGVTAFRSRSTDQLSGGEWQRTRIARALAQEAEVLVLDEPTTYLDVAHEMSLFELVKSLASDGRAVLVVSHQINLVARFADSMILLDRGRVVSAGAPEQVMRGDLLERVYEWPLVVIRDPATGAPALVPLRKR